MADIWEAKQYLRFEAERKQPAIDLLARIHPVTEPNVIFDLGCGTGNITLLLEKAWPTAQIIAMDSSANMLEKAKVLSTTIQWIEANVETWQPAQLADVIFCNASLQWLDNHQALFPHLLTLLNPHGILAIQMPRNFFSPSHQLLAELTVSEQWAPLLKNTLRYEVGENVSPVAAPAFYYDLLAKLTTKLAVWETDYYFGLEGENPVLEWMMGTGLRPVLKKLSDIEQKVFLKQYAEKLLNAYPKDAAGKTLFQFKRLFIVAENN